METIENNKHIPEPTLKEYYEKSTEV